MFRRADLSGAQEPIQEQELDEGFLELGESEYSYEEMLEMFSEAFMETQGLSALGEVRYNYELEKRKKTLDQIKENGFSCSCYHHNNIPNNISNEFLNDEQPATNSFVRVNEK